MRTRTKALVAGAGGLLAAWVGWGLYADRTTERVPSETVASFDGVELRRYPRTVLVETTAEDEDEAFGRLFRYVSGENEADETVSTIAPVGTTSPLRPTTPSRTTATDATSPRESENSATVPTRPVRKARAEGENVPMTAPVRTEPVADDGPVTMAFYLPAEYGPDRAPTPADSRIRLVVEPPRTLAVRSFAWYPTDDRVERNLRRLRDALADRAVEVRGRPALLRYDDPWTPPFMRRNEVAVEVAGDE